VWPSDVIGLPRTLWPLEPPTPPPLPLYVEPAQGEALFSWLLRLAARLRVSFHTLASQSFGIDDRLGHTHWWRRLDIGALERIASRTDVSVARLRQMTLAGAQPVYRDDEVSARFAGRHYNSRGPLWRRHCFAVCGPCLESDTTPYLRTAWLIGWIAICPHHGVILIERCKACGFGLRVAPFATVAAFSPTTCTRCGRSLLDNHYPPAHPSVARIQAAMLQGKYQGITELEGLGRLTWQEMVSLADVLIGMIWTDLTPAEQQAVFLMYASDPYVQLTDQDAIYDCRHGSLQFLSWLIEDWPDSPGAQVGQSMLLRWLMTTFNRLGRHLPPMYGQAWSTGPTNFDPTVRARLEVLVSAFL
jgi:hypothetical protein